MPKSSRADLTKGSYLQNISEAMATMASGQNVDGSIWTDASSTVTTYKIVSLIAATAETTIWQPAAGKRFRLMGLFLTCGAASTLTFNDGTGLLACFQARGGTDVPISVPNLGSGLLSGAADRRLTVIRSVSCTLDGMVWGTEE